MKTLPFVLLFLCFSTLLFGMDCLKKLNVYCIPGQGADQRLFANIDLEDNFELKYINYFTPKENTSLKEYALQLSEQIDTTQQFALVGVSLGGMIATELSELLPAEKVIIISSAKNRHELPRRYTFQRRFPLYKIFPPSWIKRGAKLLQPLVEPDRRKEKVIFKGMMNDKDPLSLKRTIQMIVNWKRIENPEGIIHIHGKKDHTIPHRNVKYDYLVRRGSHMMTLTRGSEISTLLNEILHL